MNESRLNTLVYILIGIETTIIISSYMEYIGFIAFCMGGIYVLTALSDYWSKSNIQITRLLLILSLFITIPRVIIQTQEVIGKEKEYELSLLNHIPKPIKRELRTEIFDCSRIPNWQGELQMNCNLSNLEQRKMENQVEERYLIEMGNYERELQDRKKSIDNSYLKYLTAKSFSIILLYILITPIIPLLILFLVHGDREYLAEVLNFRALEEKNIDIQEVSKNRKTIAKKLLISGFKMEEIQCEVGVSRATLYRWRKELEYSDS